MPDSFCTTADGLLLVANGIDSVLRWDGLTDEMEEAGMVAPTVALTLTPSGVGSITGTYTAYLRFVDNRGNFSNLSPISAEITPSSNSTISYTGVQLPTQNKVRRRQILRNTTGQTRVYYVDVDTDDLTSTSFSSTKTDSQLQAETAVALLDEQNRDLAANVNATPLDTKAFILAHHEYIFMAGEEPYTVGSVALTFGSANVVGHNTEWPGNFAGRFLWLPGTQRLYEIQSVDADAQTLTLTEPYEEATDPYTSYSIRPATADRRNVYFCVAGKPESWPATYAVSPQEDGDEITGLMSKGTFVYILESRHIHKLTFQDSPLEDGFVFPSISRGCVNNRSFAVVDERALMMDEAGIYAFSGGQQMEDLSTPIQDLFETNRTGRSRRYRIHWEAKRWFHCVYDPGERIARWFVSLEGIGIPRHALALDVARATWWVEEFPFPVGASVVGTIRGARRVLLGGPGGRVYAMGEGTLDLVDGDAQTVRGQVTSARLRSLTDTQASFTSDCVNAPVWIVSGKGKGQVRFIRSVTATQLSLNLPWTVKPNSTSVYQIGGVRYRYRTGWFRYANMERDNTRRLEVVFEPCLSASLLNARLYLDRSKTPVEWDFTQSSSQADGFAVTQGDSDWVADLTKPIGLVQRRIDGQKELYVDGQRFPSWEFDGVTNRDAIVLYQITIDGVQSRERGG